MPSHELEHHHARQHDGAGVDDILVGIFGSSAVGRFKNGVLVADVGARSDAQPAHLRSCGVGDVVAVEVWSRQNGVFIGASHDLLEDAVGDTVVDHQLRLPRAFAMRGVYAVDDALHLSVQRLAEVLRRELHAGLYQLGVLFNGQAWIAVEVVDDPAFALGDHLLAEFLRRQFVAPLAERAFGELLNVPLVNERDRLPAILQRVLDGHPDQALGAGNRDRLDTDTRIFADALVGAGQHLVVDEIDQLSGLRGPLLPFDSRVNVFGILAENHKIHPLRMLHWRRDAPVVLHGAHAAIQIENLTQGNVQRADPAANGRGQWAFDADTQIAECSNGLIGKPCLEPVHRLLAGKYFVPGHAALSVVGDIHSSIEDTHRSLPYVASGTVALNKGNDGVIRNNELSVEGDLGTAGRQGNTVIRRRHEAPREFSR